MSVEKINRNWCGSMSARRQTPAASYKVANSYEQFAIRLIEESGLTSVVGECRDLLLGNPSDYVSLTDACRRMALEEVGYAAGILSATGSLNDSFSRMMVVLDSCINADPRFADKTDEEKKQLSYEATQEFAAFCRDEVKKPNGIIASMIKAAVGVESSPDAHSR